MLCLSIVSSLHLAFSLLVSRIFLGIFVRVLLIQSHLLLADIFSSVGLMSD